MTWNMVGMILIVLFKVLGILLLILLCLAVLVLFAPVRYRIKAVFDEGRQVCGSFYWLGFVIRLPFRWEEDTIHWKLRILGIPVYGSNRGARQKASEDSSETDKERTSQQETEEKRYKPSGDVQNKKKPVHHPSADGKKRKITEEKKESDTIWERIRGFIAVMKHLFRMVRHKIRSLQDLIRLLQEEYAKRFICITKDNMLHLWKQLRPRKIRGDIRFGTGDPCSTGQILGLIAVFYGWIGSGVQITPDFDEPCFEGRLVMKGRIRMITIIVTAVKIMFHKDFKQLQREWERWKEEF